MACPSKKNSNKPLNMKLVSIMSALLVLCSVGSIAGTYSWYEYNARASLNYHGTAVGDASGMSVGIYFGYILENPKMFGLIADPDKRPGLYWTINNKIDQTVIDLYCSMHGYASNMLQPVTSGHYKNNDKLFLNSAPVSLGNYNPDYPAELYRYTYLPLAFKIDSMGNENPAITNERVLLSNVKVEGNNTIQNGLRIYFDNDDNSFIFNPNVKENGHDLVGGPLDLDLDGFFDYELNYETLEYEEYFYGESINEVVRSDTKSIYTEPVESSIRNTFNGVSAENVYSIDMDKTLVPTCEYLGTNDVIGVKPIGFIDGISNIIRVDMTIFAEGWSPFISFNGGYKDDTYFNLDLSFELWGG